MKTNTPGSAGNLGGATMNSSRSGGTSATGGGGGARGSARSPGTRATGRPAPRVVKSKAPPAKEGTASPSGGRAPAKRTTKKTTAPPAPAAPATPQGRMARADAAVQARMSSIGGRTKSAFKKVPGSSQAAGMARKTGTTSVKAYNKLPGGKKTKIAIAGGAGLVGAGMYADRNSGNSSSGKPKNGDTKTFGGRKATYRNGSWYAN